MFLASDGCAIRERKIRRFLASEPSLALILAAVNFEWTVCRAIMFLSPTPNITLRSRMAGYYSLERYKDIWREEVSAPRGHRGLAQLVENWSRVREAFEARNRLVHGRDRYTRNMAEPHVEALLDGVKYLDGYCEDAGHPLRARMPIRRSRPSS
jgi:hypothetical protein